jgi:hypothetical protein
MQSRCYKQELPSIKDALRGFCDGQAPKLIYTFVNQKTNQRFFF